MKKIILTIMMLASFQGFAGQDGGGGGVIKRDGQYLTFGSAKVKLSSPQGIENVPGLELLLNVLDASKSGIPEQFHGQLVNALLPSEERRYFRIDQSQLSSQTYARLIAEYSKLWKGQIDPSNLELAAITVAQDTFLLPPFFRLNQTEQAAILFHESIWLLKPSISYDELVAAEMTMQSHIEKYGTTSTYNPDLVLVFGKILNNYALVLSKAIQADLDAGLFTKPVSEEVLVQVSKRKNEMKTVQKVIPIELEAILGNLGIGHSHLSSSGRRLTDEESGLLISRLREALVKYPQYKSIKTLYSLRGKISGLITNDYMPLVERYKIHVGTNGDKTRSCVSFSNNLDYRAKICFGVEQ